MEIGSLTELRAHHFGARMVGQRGHGLALSITLLPPTLRPPYTLMFTYLFKKKKCIDLIPKTLRKNLISHFDSGIDCTCFIGKPKRTCIQICLGGEIQETTGGIETSTIEKKVQLWSQASNSYD